MIREIPRPIEDSGCFFCGPDNAHGLHMTFYHDDERQEVFADYLPDERFQGAGQILHGGMQMGFLDEIMWWACLALMGVKEAVTVTAACKFLRPVYIGRPIRITSTVHSHEGNAIKLRGKIVDDRGKTCTTMKGEYRVLGPEHFARLLER